MYYRNATADWKPNGTTESSASADGSSNDGTLLRAGTASVVVVGSSASIETAPTAAESESETDAQSVPGREVLIPIDDYRPGLTVRVIERLPAPIVVRLLRLPNDETVPVLTRPDEYTGYVVRSESGSDLVHSTTNVFTRDSLEDDARYAFESDSQVFSTRLNLFRATARRVGEDADPASVLEESENGSEDDR